MSPTPTDDDPLLTGEYVPLKVAETVLNANYKTVTALVEAGVLTPIDDQQSGRLWFSVEEVARVGRQRRAKGLVDRPLMVSTSSPGRRLRCARCRKRITVSIRVLGVKLCSACSESVKAILEA